MTFVIDASIVCSWALDDESHPTAQKALDRLRAEQAVAPAIWWFEARNALVMSERRGRIGEADVARFRREVAKMPIEIDREPVDAELLGAARRHGLTIYDAAYLELALRKASPLATLDAALAAAAKVEGVEVF